MGMVDSFEAKMNYISKLFNACIRFDSVVGVSVVESYSYSTLPNQVSIWKMEHEVQRK